MTYDRFFSYIGAVFYDRHKDIAYSKESESRTKNRLFEEINDLGHRHLEEKGEDGHGVEEPVEDVEDGQIVGLLVETRGSLYNQTEPVAHQDVSGT